MSTITLPNIRVSSDLTVKVRLTDDGVAIDWTTLSRVRATIYSDAQRALAGRCDVFVDAEDPTLLVCQYAATKPQYVGVNRIVVSATYMGEMKTYDKPAFTFVRWTADQEGEEITIDDPDVDVEITVEDISSSILQEAVDAAFTAADRANDAAAAAEHMVDIHTGPQGKSAYEVAVEEGYVGTEEEWLASLKGPVGETPDISIGTVTTVEPGTPAAASMGGTPEAPVLNLSIPKGLVGATPNITVGTVTTGQPGTPVVVTITGTPEAPVLNVTIPQGMQGNTGSSVDYPYELVNNLTTNDATKGLSAAQGVVLDGKVSQLEAEVNGVSVSGANDTISRSDYVKVIPGHTYRCFLSNPSIARNNVSYTSEGYDILSIVSFTSGLVQVSVLFKVGANMKLVPYNDFYDIEIPAGADYIRYSIRANSGTAQMFWLEDITNISVNVDDAITGSKTRHIGFNLLDTSKAMLGYISKTDGRYNLLTSGVVYATDFIPVSTRGIYAYNGYAYGSAGGFAVYNANKEYIRGNGSGNPNNYTYQSGDAYVRFTYKSDNGYQVIVECFEDGTHPSISGTFNPPYHEQVIAPFNGTQVLVKENVPSIIPAFSLAGQDGIVNKSDTLAAGTILRTNGYPFYIKGRANVSARCKFATFSTFYVGTGIGGSNGIAVCVTSTAIQLVRYTGTSYNTTLLQSIDHGLTLTAFADVEVEFGFHTATARLVTATGSFLAEFNDMSNPEHYGQPFIYSPSGDFTNVFIRTYLKDFRRNVWVIGDSYTSMYQERWPYQMIENMKIDSFLLDGLAGGTSQDMFPELQRMLSLGTPKFLVWCLGMNDYIWQWMQYAKEVEMVCRERGITLIYQTIPLPTSGYAHKQRINEYIKASGYRYIDSCDAVVADEATRAWYDGMLDDGVHPTALGAKALAGQVLVDFPELLQ